MVKINLQVILQFCGVTLATAMAMHIACTMPTATGHSIHLDDQLDAVDDITHKRFSVAEGFSRVSEEPGLGFEVDEELLYKYKDNVPDEIAPYIGVVRLGGGHSIDSLRQPNLVKIMGQEEGTIRNLTYNRWFDDGSEQWAQTYERVTNEEWYID